MRGDTGGPGCPQPCRQRAEGGDPTLGVKIAAVARKVSPGESSRGGDGEGWGGQGRILPAAPSLGLDPVPGCRGGRLGSESLDPHPRGMRAQCRR